MIEDLFNGGNGGRHSYPFANFGSVLLQTPLMEKPLKCTIDSDLDGNYCWYQWLYPRLPEIPEYPGWKDLYGLENEGPEDYGTVSKVSCRLRPSRMEEDTMEGDTVKTLWLKPEEFPDGELSEGHSDTVSTAELLRIARLSATCIRERDSSITWDFWILLRLSQCFGRITAAGEIRHTCVWGRFGKNGSIGHPSAKKHTRFFSGFSINGSIVHFPV